MKTGDHIKALIDAAEARGLSLIELDVRQPARAAFSIGRRGDHPGGRIIVEADWDLLGLIEDNFVARGGGCHRCGVASSDHRGQGHPFTMY